MKFYLILALCCIVSISCGNNEKGTSSQNAGVQSGSGQNGRVDPCEIFTLDDLNEVFSIESTSTVNTDRTGNFPTCGYTWNSGRKRMMKVGGTEIEVDVENRVTIVIVENANAQMYETSIGVYPETTPLEIGEMSVWSDSRSQMTFLGKGYLVHVNVDAFDDNEADKNKAIWLAGEILGKL